MVIPYVGYYYAPDIKDEFGNTVGDSVFILPKVFLTQAIVDGEQTDLAFGQYDPKTIIDLNSEDLLAKKDNEVIFGLSIWLYRAIAHFVERKSTTSITTDGYIQNVVSTKGADSETFLDIILSLLRFHREHKNLFTYITILNSSGRSTINWNKTINRTNAIIKEHIPFYPEVIAKGKAINMDEDLIVLFYSVLNYLKNYNFKIERSIKYDILKPKEVQNLINSGKGIRLLKKIRKKYFTDELVSLWNLLMVFFTKAHTVAIKRYSKEKLLVRNFNIVFEDMIDSMIGDSGLDKDLQKQKDGKIIDHIYKSSSLIPSSDIYYIGDSKYYKDSNDVTGTSLYKQYTYAKNVIQYNMDIFNGNIKGKTKNDLGEIRYCDKGLTEGYNITPNFFIRGSVNLDGKKSPNYSDDELYKEGKAHISYQHFDRLFDRDTLILQTYNVNFLFVLSSYVTRSNNENFKNRIRQKFRADLLRTLNEHYKFFKVTPKNDTLDGFVELYFKRLNGKIYKGQDIDDFIWLALERCSINSEDLKEESILLDIIKDALIEETPLV